MRAYEYLPSDGEFRIELVDRPEPSAGPLDVVVRIGATSLNYRDLIALRNKAGRPVAGVVPLSDGAGVVESVGAEVSLWKPGDRVAGCFFRDWTSGRFQLGYHKTDLGGSLDGVLAEKVTLPEHAWVRVPEHLTIQEAACLPCAGLTAWYALTTRGGFQAGDSLLTIGTGGVSVFALQFAVALGGSVIIISSSDEKLEHARTLGATHTINYRTHPDWEKEVWRLTEGRGVDHVVEVGGPGTLGKSMNCVAGGGQIALIGVLTGFGPPQDGLFPLLSRNVRLDGIYVGSRADFEAMNAFLVENQIRPVIDRVFAFSEAPEAFAHLESGSHFGKVVVQVGN